MKKASETLSASQRAGIEDIIAQAERTTSAEIVVVVATRSGRYDRAEDIFGVLLALAGVAGAWLLWQDLHPATGDWATGHELTLGLLPVLVLFSGWWMVGAALATRVPFLARAFIPKVQLEAEVRRRGFEAFHLFRVGHTKGRNGVLIYVSMLERMAWVVGDEAVAKVLPPETWTAARDAVMNGMSRADYATGIGEGVRLCAGALAGPFPLLAGDVDELANTVHFLD